MTAMLLGQLVEALQDDVVSVLSQGAETEPRIAGVELLDSHDVVRATASGHLLLGVGVDVTDPDALAVALRTAADTSCALAVKCADPVDEELPARIRPSGVPVLAVNPRMPWTRVQRLVTTVLAARAADSDPGSGSPTGGDLFSLANAVAIMDTQQVVVAYSSLPDQPIDETRRRGILGRRVPEDAMADHLDRKVWTSDTVARHQRPGNLPRLAVVVRAGEDVLGSLWVAFPDDAPVPDCGPTLQEAARVAALHMLALRRQVDAEQESRDRALRSALEGRAGQHDLADGARLPGVLVGMSEATQGGEESSDAGAAARRRAALLRLVDLAVLDGRSLGYEPAAALLGDRVYLLLPTAGSGPVSTGVLLEHLLDRARHSLHRSFVAVGSPAVGALSPLLRARRDIDSALDHLRERRADPGVYRTEDLRPELVLRRLVGAVRADADLRTGIVERLRAHDAEHATAYAATLLAYLRHFGDVVAASGELHIHQNTLRLRLRRAEQLFGVSLADPTRRLLLTLELAALTQP
ncbi:helix-turn-helix domain-containing protein [Streptomyces sp. ND05-3B]|nr:helix-turn-helix domain-containing protein [Streptomyces caniscabiei]MBE4754665.1 helix-turn-helix domain-containing protein [Streptomyces caniscabiei]MBE4768514.1 helix-turn-helix domain-containing protein [Streptomyces caniscabiei]MBE4781982.1 helix-turn-helix domain-containing protein [Streptomyces caniscabiei]MBE4793272.1 helix-turn-helix domain-containing protein [Streptomyces caniscabiei]